MKIVVGRTVYARKSNSGSVEPVMRVMQPHCLCIGFRIFTLSIILGLVWLHNHQTHNFS
jgi:hypothetical protein